MLEPPLKGHAIQFEDSAADERIKDPKGCTKINIARSSMFGQPQLMRFAVRLAPYKMDGLYNTNSIGNLLSIVPGTRMAATAKRHTDMRSTGLVPSTWLL